jgi:hypothetical protein
MRITERGDQGGAGSFERGRSFKAINRSAPASAVTVRSAGPSRYRSATAEVSVPGVTFDVP